MHAFFVALDACPLLAVFPLLFYSRRHPVRWAVATLICGIVAAFFLCYLLYVQQIILSTPYGAPVPFWVEIWLPVSLLHVESNSFTKVFPCDITSL
ncbi:MAG: hypothetical protein IKW48_05695 [Akkermansia sp.]|nr:hypothetical protein [Akkermansia sp.]